MLRYYDKDDTSENNYKFCKQNELPQKVCDGINKNCENPIGQGYGCCSFDTTAGEFVWRAGWGPDIFSGKYIKCVENDGYGGLVIDGGSGGMWKHLDGPIGDALSKQCPDVSIVDGDKQCPCHFDAKGACV